MSSKGEIHPLVELASLEIHVIIDNELDPITPSQNPSVQQFGNLKDIALANGPLTDVRNTVAEAGNVFEARMDKICCSAHGLSLLITGTTIEGKQHSLLFDTGPEESAWERNAKRLNIDAAKIEMIHLSHWHRDHSGGMLQVLRMINSARLSASNRDLFQEPVTVDLHPSRPIWRGTHRPGVNPLVSLEADPSFEEIESLGAKVSKNDQAHTVLDGMFLISGEIPRVTSYEKGLKGGVRFNGKEWEEDTMIRDERLVMCKVKDKGIVMFTGCSHAGVINASKYASFLGGGDNTPLYAVMGGYHLADAESDHIQATAEAFKELGTQVLLAGQCTGWRAKFQIEKEMPGSLVPSFVGSRFMI